ncbi:hypothetical protein [Campylobacter aviculae]|uniref:DUF2513 domain-containing protein n=1 Tax=Campylobacter aviculae TaxID=2510190 RepID=A0A4U7BNZ7_9BACT|nr:hypothetical protein [Campylobacter aviculae]TKX32411.1 hypothetical protein CQA76_03555 [Campylobacter aviculae]
MQSNIEKFDFYSAKVLAILLDNFPIKKDIYILKDLIKDSDATKEDVKFVYETIIALRDFDFISFNEEVKECFFGVRLTLKSLEILKSIPKTLQNNKTLGDKLRDSIKLADEEAIKQSISLAFSLANKFF